LPTFAALDLIEPLLRAVDAQGYTTPTPIQRQAIPPLLQGRDVLGCAQTGTGKTAAFTLPVLQHMASRPSPRKGRRAIRALVLTPTRELAAQIGESVNAYGRHLKVDHTVIFGGVKQGPQVRVLQRGVDVLVATPGRLLDLIGQGYIDLGDVEFFVLDEADRMLDMGFIHDVRRVLRLLPGKRQNLLFSATMPESIVQLAGSFLTDPVRVEVTPQATTVEKIEQSIMFCHRTDKQPLLAWLIKKHDVESAIVFTRTKHGANRLVKQLLRDGISAAAIHGNKSQAARTRALEAFRAGDIPILVATDIASRGLDVEGVSHVFNYDLPNEPESYVHRIGRTARAGRGGVAIGFCDESEGEFLRDIERLIGLELTVDEDQPWHAEGLAPPAGRPVGRGGDRPSGGRGGGKPAGGRGGGRRSGTAPTGRSAEEVARGPSPRPRRRPGGGAQENKPPTAEAAPPAPRRRRRRRRPAGAGKDES
jgi:ATP-dependent RNA helicase RhlE